MHVHGDAPLMLGNGGDSKQQSNGNPVHNGSNLILMLNAVIDAWYVHNLTTTFRNNNLSFSVSSMIVLVPPVK